MTCALNGTLNQKKLDSLLASAATAQMIDAYRGDLARRAEHVLVGAWHRAIETCADTILDSVRSQFDEAAAGIARAKALISMDSSPEHVLNSAEPAAVTEWQALPTYLQVVDKIGTRIAAQFGPRLGMFPMIREYPLADGHLLEDRALFATNGGLLVDSSMFRRPAPSARQSRVGAGRRAQAAHRGIGEGPLQRACRGDVGRCALRTEKRTSGRRADGRRPDR